MKKTLLIAALICCMMPVMAQRSNDKTPAQQLKETKQKVEQLNRMAGSYLQKLDSVVEPGSKETMEYDQQLNCTKTTLYYARGTSGWEPSSMTEYEYDNQNRVISMTYTSVGYEEWASRITLEYDAQGHLSAEYDWSKNEGEWIAVHKVIFEYNAQGNIFKENMYGKDENNEWYLSSYWEYTYENELPIECLGYMWSYVTGDIELNNRTEWFYDGQLCSHEDYSLWDLDNNIWVISYRTEYMYNGDGLVKEEIFQHTYEFGGELEPSTRAQYEYDTHHNVTLISNYRYEEYWEPEAEIAMEYDLTILASDIAGFATLYGDGINSMFINKLLKSTTTDPYGYMEERNLYYSTVTGVNENVESLLSVWPNPVSETLNLKGDMTQVQIYSIDGRLVISLDKDFESINVSALATGSYLLKATLNDGSVTTQKFLKK